MYFLTPAVKETLSSAGWVGDLNEFTIGPLSGWLTPALGVNSFLSERDIAFTTGASPYDGISVLQMEDGDEDEDYVAEVPVAEAPVAEAPVAEAPDTAREAVAASATTDSTLSSADITIEAPSETWDGRGRTKYMKVVEEELQGVYSKVNVSVPNGEVSEPKDAENDLNIRIWSSPDTKAVLDDDSVIPPEKLFGKPVLCRDPAFSYSEEGVAIKDPDSDFVLMEFVAPNYLYFMWDAVQKDAKASEHIFRECLKLFKSKLGSKKLKEFIKDIEKKRLEKNRKLLISFVKASLDQEFKEAKGKVDRLTNEIEQHQKNMTLKIRERTRTMLLVDGGSSEDFEHKANKMIRDLYSLNHVKRVEIVDNGIHVFTDEIFCVDPRTDITHSIGCFRIEIRSDENRAVALFNTTRQVDGYERGMQAPHVFPAGNPCLGDLVQSLPEVQARHDYASIALLCILFLEHVNVDDSAGRKINRWPMVQKDGSLIEWKDRKDDKRGE